MRFTLSTPADAAPLPAAVDDVLSIVSDLQPTTTTGMLCKRLASSVEALENARSVWRPGDELCDRLASTASRPVYINFYRLCNDVRLPMSKQTMSPSKFF